MTLVDAADPRLDGDDGIFSHDETYRGILVCATLGTYRTIEVALHEITHAINWTCDIFTLEDMAEEEAATTKQGAAWARVYVDNPKFCKWLNHAVQQVRKERASA